MQLFYKYICRKYANKKIELSQKALIIGYYIVCGMWYVARSCQRVIALFITPLCQATAEYENKTKLKIKYSH